jgi:hypothetical protein
MRRLGRCIVVGGHSRGVGKTALAEQLLRHLGSPRVAAVKISAHRHAAAGTSPPVFEEALAPSPLNQTGRYLAAGADRAWLCRCPTARLSDAAAFVQTLLAEGRDVIVESNRIVEYLVPDLLFFVASARVTDWKPSSRLCLPQADAIVLSPGTLAVPPEARRLGGPHLACVSIFSFTEAWSVPGMPSWLHRRLEAPVALPAHESQARRDRCTRGVAPRLPGACNIRRAWA